MIRLLTSKLMQTVQDHFNTFSVCHGHPFKILCFHFLIKIITREDVLFDRDKNREKQRQIKIQSDEPKSSKFRRPPRSQPWSKQKERKDRKKKRKEQKESSKKRKADELEEEEEEEEDFQDDLKLMKKLKKGKVCIS